MAFYFDDPDYNPRVGAGRGRVRKEDFSIDGKSWNFRDPYNQRQIDSQNVGRERGKTTINENAQSMTNPLYDYGYGRVRDAAKALKINNVNSKEEVGRILNYIRNPPGAQQKTEETAAPVEEPQTVFTPEVLATGKPGPSDIDGPTEPQGPDVASLFADQIASMQQMFQQSMQQQQQQYMQMQQAQDERMAALQQQMQQSMVAQQARPEVAGVKMAEGAAGTPMQIARRGVTGAFGRRGMRISSINV